MLIRPLSPKVVIDAPVRACVDLVQGAAGREDQPSIRSVLVLPVVDAAVSRAAAVDAM
jgi:hypothetical protein